MESISILINPFLIKEILNSYSDSSSFTNYQKICRDYYKLYYKIIKKFDNYSKDKLRNKVKHWFFNQSLENKLKICTVENEFFCQIIYQMYHYTQSDKTRKFNLKTELTDVYELNNKNILKDYEFEYYFTSISEKDFSPYGNNYFNENNDDTKNSLLIDQFINEIIFFSVHHKPFPDCFCLSPTFLLQEEKFNTTFNNFGNNDYFSSLIEPYYNNEINIYSYKLPNWLSNSYKSSFYSITQYIIAFIEQVIMIKFILNNYILYNNKKNNYNSKENTCLFSLINDANLNRIFNDRKTLINYFNIKYKEENLKIQLIDDANIEKIFEGILNNNKIMNKIIYFKNFQRNKNYNGYGNPMLIQPLLGYNNNNYIYNTLYDDIHLFLFNNTEDQNNYIKQKIKRKLIEVIERTDNITLIDYLLFKSFNGLWEFDFFINSELIEYILNKFNEQNYNDLLKEEITLKKKNRRKKKKKNQNNETIENINNNIIEDTQKNNKEDMETNIYKIELECYNELFKDKEKLLYIPYYFSTDLELKNRFNKIKENKLKLIEKNNKIQDIKEISNYIKNEFLLKYMIDKVIHLQPDNYVSFFQNDNEEKLTEIKIKKINGLKLRKPKKSNTFLDSDNFGTIILNLNNKIINDNEVILDDSKKGQLIEKNIINKENIIRINSKDKKNKNNISKNDNLNIVDDDKLNKDKIINLNININTIKDTNNNNNINKNNNKKRGKSPNMFFLFDTVKNKNKKKTKSKSPNNIKSDKKNDNFALSFISSNNKSSKINKDYHLSFMEKLHNNILKNDKKVDNILQLLTNIKNYCIEEIKKIIKRTYDNVINYYSINLYGSFTTGLMIEASDIDIRIKINDCKKKDFEKYFFDLHNKLKDENKFENITPISTASVPVIKLIINIENFINGEKNLEKDFIKLKQLTLFKNFLFDKMELLQIKIDITFIINYSQNNNEIINKIQNDKLDINSINNNNSEISSVSYIKKQLEEYPEIKPVLKLLKRYFYTKKMNSSFEGGLSSYNLFLLILSFAKYQKIYNLNQNESINLGLFLVQFLEFFGRIFDFRNYLIDINSPYIYQLNNYIGYKSGKTIVILDPLTGLNASKSSYKIGDIQKMFLNAFDFFEKERINYENEIIKENNDKRDNDKNNNFEVILGLAKIQKNDYYKKSKKDKMNTNIIDKFFFT